MRTVIVNLHLPIFVRGQQRRIEQTVTLEPSYGSLCEGMYTRLYVCRGRYRWADGILYPPVDVRWRHTECPGYDWSAYYVAGSAAYYLGSTRCMTAHKAVDELIPKLQRLGHVIHDVDALPKYEGPVAIAGSAHVQREADTATQAAETNTD